MQNLSAYSGPTESQVSAARTHSKEVLDYVCAYFRGAPGSDAKPTPMRILGARFGRRTRKLFELSVLQFLEDKEEFTLHITHAGSYLVAPSALLREHLLEIRALLGEPTDAPLSPADFSRYFSKFE